MAKKRKTAGRPATMEGAKLISFRLPESLIERIDSYADDNFAAGRSDAVRELLEYALKRKGQ